jgi:putative lipoic acid-binding regulatory protein
MTCDPFGDEEIEFPVEVHFRLVCEAGETVYHRVHEAAKELKLEDKLQPTNQSSSGKYQSYQLSLIAESLEHMQGIDNTFRAVDGVKMVL